MVQRANEWMKILLPWVNALVLGMFTVIGFFLVQEFSDVHTNTDEIYKLKQWKAETSGNRFTSKDGQEVWQAIAELKTMIAKLPSEVPPEWFKEYVDTIRDDAIASKTLSHTVDKKLDVVIKGVEVNTQMNVEQGKSIDRMEAKIEIMAGTP